MNKAQRLVSAHVLGNVTALIEELDKYDSELALDLLHGDPESSVLAYPAAEIILVTPWLAHQLKHQGERVLTVGLAFYWARGTAGSAISLDDVIIKIARENIV